MQITTFLWGNLKRTGTTAYGIQQKKMIQWNVPGTCSCSMKCHVLFAFHHWCLSRYIVGLLLNVSVPLLSPHICIIVRTSPMLSITQWNKMGLNVIVVSIYKLLWCKSNLNTSTAMLINTDQRICLHGLWSKICPHVFVCTPKSEICTDKLSRLHIKCDILHYCN